MSKWCTPGAAQHEKEMVFDQENREAVDGTQTDPDVQQCSVG